MRRDARGVGAWGRGVAGFLAIVPILATGGCGSDPSYANAGDCVHVGTDPNSDARKVTCTDVSANYSVLANFEDTTDTSKCDTYKSTHRDLYALYQIGNGKNYVLCLNLKGSGYTFSGNENSGGNISGGNSGSGGSSGSGGDTAGNSSGGYKPTRSTPAVWA